MGHQLSKLNNISGDNERFAWKQVLSLYAYYRITWNEIRKYTVMEAENIYLLGNIKE